MFAEMAIVETDAKIGNAKKMFQHWLEIPGYRDALVHDFLLSVGIYSEGDILVMNVTSALGKPRSKSGGYTSYPRKNQQNVPAEAQTAELGPEFEELMARNGHAGVKVIGFPLTMHFLNEVQGNRQSWACKVSSRGKDIAGAILLDGGNIRQTTAPGMVTFYPYEPLPHGEIDVVWTWEQDGAPQRLAAPFKTK
jgi:hypothetical protein